MVDDDGFKFNDFRLITWNGICRALRINLEVSVLNVRVNK